MKGNLNNSKVLSIKVQSYKVLWFSHYKYQEMLMIQYQEKMQAHI